jgi:hypothetical protein
MNGGNRQGRGCTMLMMGCGWVHKTAHGRNRFSSCVLFGLHLPDSCWQSRASNALLPQHPHPFAFFIVGSRLHNTQPLPSPPPSPHLRC